MSMLPKFKNKPKTITLISFSSFFKNGVTMYGFVNIQKTNVQIMVATGNFGIWTNIITDHLWIFLIWRYLDKYNSHMEDHFNAGFGVSSEGDKKCNSLDTWYVLNMNSEDGFLTESCPTLNTFGVV